MMFDKIVDLPVIEAGRFALRPLKASDAGLLEMYSGDLRVARATKTMPHPLPPGAVEAFLARASEPDREDDIWAIDGAGSGFAEVMGLIWLTRMDRDQSEVTFWVAPAFWNMGIASAALTALVKANPHASRTMFAEVFQDNPTSARVLTNLGFEYLGDAEAYSVARDQTVPTWTYVKKLAP